MEESLKQFAEELKKLGLKGDDKFKFSCYHDQIICYTQKNGNSSIELSFITDKECLPNEKLKDLFFDPTKYIKYVSCGVYENGTRILGFSFNKKNNPMFKLSL